MGDLGQIGLRFDEMEVLENSSLVNRVIGEIEIRSNHGFLIVGIRSADGTTQKPPCECPIVGLHSKTERNKGGRTVRTHGLDPTCSNPLGRSASPFEVPVKSLLRRMNDSSNPQALG